MKSVGILYRNWEVRSAFLFVCASLLSLPPKPCSLTFPTPLPQYVSVLSSASSAGLPLASAGLTDSVWQSSSPSVQSCPTHSASGSLIQTLWRLTQNMSGLHP